MKRRLWKLRRSIFDDDGRCALWIEIMFAEVVYRRGSFAVWAHMLGASESFVVGRGSTIRAAVRDAERTVKRHKGDASALSGKPNSEPITEKHETFTPPCVDGSGSSSRCEPEPSPASKEIP